MISKETGSIFVEGKNGESATVRERIENYFDHLVSKGLYACRNVLYSRFFEKRDNHIADALQGVGLQKLRMLDAGCGDGSRFISLREKLGDLEIVYRGFDFSLEMVRKARERNLDVRRGDMVDLKDYGDGGFDAVLSLFGSISYLPNEQERRTALREFRRVLTDGGLLALDIFYRRKEKDCKYSLENNSTVRGWAHVFRKGYVGKVLASEGFTVIHSSTHRTLLPDRKDGPKDNLHEFYICSK